MTYKITPERQKLLTEMIGECWHEAIRGWSYLGDVYTCMYCHQASLKADYFLHRTFDNPADQMTVFRWLVDNGKWNGFFDHIIFTYTTLNVEDGDEVSAWLLYDAEKFCALVAQAKEEGVI